MEKGYRKEAIVIAAAFKKVFWRLPSMLIMKVTGGIAPVFVTPIRPQIALWLGQWDCFRLMSNDHTGLVVLLVEA